VRSFRRRPLPVEKAGAAASGFRSVHLRHARASRIAADPSPDSIAYGTPQAPAMVRSSLSLVLASPSVGMCSTFPGRMDPDSPVAVQGRGIRCPGAGCTTRSRGRSGRSAGRSPTGPAEPSPSPHVARIRSDWHANAGYLPIETDTAVSMDVSSDKGIKEIKGDDNKIYFVPLSGLESLFPGRKTLRGPLK